MKQLSIFENDDLNYRAKLEYLRNWLLDGRELATLEKLVAEVKTNPRKRPYNRYHIKNADGSIDRSDRNGSRGGSRDPRKGLKELP